jgi:hypothetical protein
VVDGAVVMVSVVGRDVEVVGGMVVLVGNVDEVVGIRVVVADVV